MPPKTKRPLFKQSHKRKEIHPSNSNAATGIHGNHDNQYGKPVKRHRSHTSSSQQPSPLPSRRRDIIMKESLNSKTTKLPTTDSLTPRGEDRQRLTGSDRIEEDSIPSSLETLRSPSTGGVERSITTVDTSVSHISQEMLYNALFGVEPGVLTSASVTLVNTESLEKDSENTLNSEVQCSTTSNIDAVKLPSIITAHQQSCRSCNETPTAGGRNTCEDSLDDDDILFGLCPEDLNFSFNNSIFLETTKTSKPVDLQTTCSVRKEPLYSDDLLVESYKTSSTRESIAVCDELSRKQSQYTVSTERHNPVNIYQSAVHSTVEGDVQAVLNKERTSFQSSTTAVGVSVSACKTGDSVSNDGTFYGLPLKVKECLEEHRGIKQLYDWQDTCLRLPSVTNGTNLIYSLPTSGGKTLVAEIIILKQLLLQNKDVLLILPFVSIVQEKVRQLTPFSTSLRFAVEEYAASKGRLPPRQRRRKCVLYIATIEKANGLVNALIELSRVQSLGLVVIDELHMLGDGSSRGATLESCLAKLQYCSPGTQLVGMSATLGNIDELATFLKAQIFSSDFRPVELVELVKLGRCVYRVQVEGNGTVNFDPLRDVQDSAHSQLDPDQLTSLVMEVVPESSCLVFCPTKKNCQNVALLLVKTLPKSLREVHRSDKQQLLKALSLEASGVCPILSQTIPYGVAYHHSGLTADERRVIEEGYLDGVLCVIACTSTLAAGVNLPAKRVILRSPYIGSQLMSRSQYKQMVGRAGRSGLTDAGESILILNHKDKEKVVSLLTGPYEVCHSSLLSEEGEALLSLLLNVIGLKLVDCYLDIQAFLKATLLCVQSDHTHIDSQSQDAVTRLVAMGYIVVETSNSGDVKYRITSLGRAAFKGCLPIHQAHTIHKELQESLQQLVLSTDLHLLYLATPLDLCTSIQPNWMVYFEVLTGLCGEDMRVAEILGVKPGYLAGKATGSARGSISTDTMRLYHRFYLTLILHSLLKLTSPEAIWRVADRFHCSRGFLQSVMNTTASHASCLVHFTAELPELWSLHLLLPAITKKLAYSSNLELVPLMEISGIKQGRARQLLSAGITTPLQLASSDPHQLCELVENMFPKQARRLIQAAKAFLTEQAEVLMEEAEELMTVAPAVK